MSARIKWWLLLGGLVLAGILLAVLLPVPSARNLLDRIRAAEREASRRVEETKSESAALKAAGARTSIEAMKHTKKANKARAAADKIAADRNKLIVRISERTTDAERARRFRERHGMSDPRDSDS